MDTKDYKTNQQLETAEQKSAEQTKAANKPLKKKKKGIIRSFFGSLFNVREWVSYDEIAYNGKWIVEALKFLFSRPKKLDPQNLNETFTDATARLQMTEDEIKVRTKHFLLMSIIYVCTGFLLFAYEIYLIIAGAPILSLIMNLALVALMGAYAYRESFWYMQMQKRKLGCTFEDWRNYMLGRVR